jgi:hypothetical protein
MIKKFDLDIIFSLLPEDDKKSFLVWDNVYSSEFNIIAIYRSPFEEKLVIPRSDYDSIIRQKERDKRLNNIL